MVSSYQIYHNYLFMKHYLFILFFSLFSVLAINAKVNITDQFDKRGLVETSWYSFSSSKNLSVPDVHIKFRYDNGIEYMEIKYAHNQEVIISKNTKVEIICDKNKHTSYCLENSISTIGGGSIDYGHSQKFGTHSKYRGDFSWLLDNHPKVIKIESRNKTLEIKLEKKYYKEISNIYKKFFETINKHYQKKK